MTLENSGRLTWHMQAQRVLIDNLVAKALAGQVLKNRGSDPSGHNISGERLDVVGAYLRLKDQPSTNIDTTNLLVAPSKLHTPF